MTVDDNLVQMQYTKSYFLSILYVLLPSTSSSIDISVYGLYLAYISQPPPARWASATSVPGRIRSACSRPEESTMTLQLPAQVSPRLQSASTTKCTIQLLQLKNCKYIIICRTFCEIVRNCVTNIELSMTCITCNVKSMSCDFSASSAYTYQCTWCAMCIFRWFSGVILSSDFYGSFH